MGVHPTPHSHLEQPGLSPMCEHVTIPGLSILLEEPLAPSKANRPRLGNKSILVNRKLGAGRLAENVH